MTNGVGWWRLSDGAHWFNADNTTLCGQKAPVESRISPSGQSADPKRQPPTCKECWGLSPKTMRNAFGVVDEFERRVAEYAGAKYGVAVDCCTNAIFLSLKYMQYDCADICSVKVPARTYVSVPMACLHACYHIEFDDAPWVGVYQLKPLPIFDGAKRFRRGMYQGGLHCLSFHTKKHLPIGRGGMILTDSAEAVKWLKRARYDGREEKHYGQGDITTLGWHMYMMPDQAARGLTLLDTMKDDNPDLTEDYPDLRTMPVFAKYVTKEIA